MSRTNDNQQQRRDFLATLGGGAAGLAVAGYTATSKGYAANEAIRVGCIGTGGRCRRLMQTLARIPGVTIAGVCDVWDKHLEMGRVLADKNAFVTKNFYRMLERKDIDAVLIGSPDHWHVPMTVAACLAGKDVYVEKPLTHDLAEGKSVLAAWKKSNQIVQIGMQQRSMPHLQKAREIIQSGQIGAVRKVHLTWNRNSARAGRRKLGIDPASVDWKSFLGRAPQQPFDEYRFRNWRWYWDFGGGIFTDLMVHFIDVAHWLLDLQSPLQAASIGDHFMAKDLWETPDTVQTLLKYKAPAQAGDKEGNDPRLQVYFEGTFVNARNAAMMEFMGTDATLYADRGRYEIHPERRRNIEYSEMVLGDGPRGADFYNKPDGELLHLTNWIECIRSRKQPNATVADGVHSAAAAHLANLSLRSGKFAHNKE